MDVAEGWQYAHYFSDPDEQWTADQPPLLERLMTGANVVGVGFGSSSRSGGRSNSSSGSGQNWVRRRRWVRIMRRRLDIPPLPFLEPDGTMYHLDDDGALIPYIEEDRLSNGSEGDGQELGSMPRTLLSSAQDYVARARYLVGTQSPDVNGTSTSAIDVRRAIAKLERATMELRQGILGE